MSQIDTGLGWLVNDAWAIQSGPAKIGSISNAGGPGYTGQPIPYCTTAVEGTVSGFYICEWASFYVAARKYFVYSKEENVDVYYALISNNSNIAISLTQGTRVGFATLIEGTGEVTEQTVTLDLYDSTSGFYYYPLPAFALNYAYNINPNLIIHTDARAALDALTISTTDFYKLNPGYAVTCFARWYTPEGTEQKSPVLISTEESFTKLSNDGTTETTSYTSIHLYEGRTFYMTFIVNLEGEIDSGGLQYADLRQFGAATPKKVFSLLAEFDFANIVVTDSPDPYQEDEGSAEGGGDGEEDESDNVDFTDPPSTSIGATGFLTIFCPSLSELQSLANFMWGSFDVDNWRKLFANPMDAILGLHIIPVPANITGTKTVKVGGIDTTIDMSYTTLRYIRRPMGTCEIPKKWGAYLDYSPYTKISVFLPYIGFKELDADDIMGQTISLQYIIDILTGACVAELKCGDTVLYSWQGNCANEVPITGSDWRGAIASAIGIAGTVAAAVATGGATAPMVAGTIASVGANSLNLKPTVNRSGAISGSAGFIGAQRPYIIRSVPNLVIPTNQNKFIGYPSFVTTSLGSLTGYNEIASIHLEGIPATGNELSEIETLLKGGVIF